MYLLKKHSSLLIFLLVLMVAIFFRFWKISNIPFGLNNDAAWEGSAALDILQGNFANYIPYATEGWRGEGIIRSVVALVMLFFGNDPVTIRISTVIFGIALIPAIFVLIRKFFDEKLAILTSFFVAISGWHITFSKTGWRAVIVPFFATLTFYFFFKGLENKKIIHFVLSGIFLAIVSFYTYDAARVVPLFFIFWLTVEAISRKSFLKTHGKNLSAFFISFFIISFPMITYAFNNWQNFTSRSEFLFVGHEIEKVGNFSPLINNIVTTTFLFNVKANGNDFFIFEPLVDEPISWLLPIGFLITLLFSLIKKDKRYFFMVCWFLASLLPGVLSVPNGNRAIGAIPAVYFFAAVGLLVPLNLISQRLKAPKTWVIFSFIVLFCIYSMFLSFKDYLGPNRKELAGFYPETLITTNYIKTILSDYDIYLTDNYPRELLTYYLYKGGDPFVKNYNWLENNQMFFSVEKRENKGLAFFMFDSPDNEVVANGLIKKWGGQKFLLWYENDNILKRPASLVVLIPR